MVSTVTSTAFFLPRTLLYALMEPVSSSRMMGQMFSTVATVAAAPDTRPVRRNWVMLLEKNW